MRTVALDVHKRCAEVAVYENAGLRRLWRIETAQLRVFAASLGPQDHVVLESTAMTWAIAEGLAEHAGRVTVFQSDAHAGDRFGEGQDRQDRRQGARAAGRGGLFAEVWAPDEVTRALRRRVAHRSRLVS